MASPALNTDAKVLEYQKEVVMSIFQTITAIPEISEEVIEDFSYTNTDLPELSYGKTEPVDFFFEVRNGRSAGEKNYIIGSCPYISS